MGIISRIRARRAAKKAAETKESVGSPITKESLKGKTISDIIPSGDASKITGGTFRGGGSSGGSGGGGGGSSSTPTPTPTTSTTKEVVVEKITSSGKFNSSERTSLLERLKIQKEAASRGRGFSKQQIQTRLKKAGGSIRSLRSGTRKRKRIIKKAGALSAKRFKVTEETAPDVFSDNSYVGFQNIASADTGFKEPFTAKRTFKNVKTAFKNIGKKKEGDRIFESFDMFTSPTISKDVIVFQGKNKQRFFEGSKLQRKIVEKTGLFGLNIQNVGDVLRSSEKELMSKIDANVLTEEQANEQYVGVQKRLLRGTSSKSFKERKTQLQRTAEVVPLIASVVAPAGAVALGGFVAGAKSSQTDVIKVDIGAITSGKTSIGGASTQRPSLKTGSLFALGVGGAGIKSLKGIAQIEKGIVQSELNLLSAQPVRNLQIIEQSAGAIKGSSKVTFTGFQNVGKLERQITFSGDIVKIGRDLTFLPLTSGKAVTSGEFVASNILGKAGPTRIQALQTFKITAVGENIPIGSIGKIQSFQTRSVGGFFPTGRGSILFQGQKPLLISPRIDFPSGIIIPKISKEGRRFAKGVELGGTPIATIDTGASLKLSEKVSLNFGNQRIGLSVIKPPVAVDKVSIQIGGGITKTPFAKTFGPTTTQKLSTPSLGDAVSTGLKQNQISIFGGTGGSKSFPLIVGGTGTISKSAGRGTYEQIQTTGFGRQTTSLRKNQLSISPQTSKISSNIKSSQIPISSLGFSQRTKTRQRSGLASSTNINQVLNLGQSNIQKSGLKSGLQQRTRQMQQQRLSTIGFGGSIAPPNFRIRTTFKPRGIGFPRLKKKTKTPRVSRGLFGVETRRKGKFTSIGSGLSLGQAVNLGTGSVSQNISASFRITGGSGSIGTPLGFRRSRKEAGVFIEKRGRRIKRRGTSQENIQLISAKRRKRKK